MDRDQSNRWARYLGSAGSMGCDKCRKARNALFSAFSDRVTVLFSGGLDSTYVAWSLKESGKTVQLITADWQYDDSDFDTMEVKRAKAIAAKLDLPLQVIGDIRVGPDQTGMVMRVPTLLAAVLSHRGILHTGDVAFGGHPSSYKLDARWVEAGTKMAEVLRPGTNIICPADGVSRADMREALPADIRPLIFSCYHTDQDGQRCGECQKCRDDNYTA